MGLVIVTTFCLGVYMSEMPLSPDKLHYYSWHKWIGVSLFLLAGLRLGLRLTTPVVHPPAAYSLQMKLAEWTHRFVYVLMFAIPLSGWLMSSAKGVPTVYFGYWQLPDLVARDAELGRNLQSLHVILNFSMAAIVSGHVMAALKHHFFDRDDVLARMLPRLRARHPKEPS
jgi:cytochrome b561